uniref:hypothetical protein n=1 Tax=Agathobacter sp. TaxID=2021311 RepID=UPI0040575765
MKYLNATVSCYKSITTEQTNIVSFNAPFNSIKAQNNDTSLQINDFSIVTQINFVGTNNDARKKDNPLEQQATIDFIIRLTKCSKTPQGYDLDSFSINLKEMYEQHQVEHACFDFLNYTRITNINQILLQEGTGRYVIKILVKKSTEKEFSIQSISQLVIL